MVASYPERSPDQMVTRLVPGAAPAGPAPGIFSGMAPPPWRIEIPAADGTPLLVLREENGKLAAEYDEARVTEAAKEFLVEMMRWAGGAGIDWKNQAKR